METDRLLTHSEDRDGPSSARGSRRSHSVITSLDPDSDNESLYIQQAVVFIEDAFHYRSINHRVDARSLVLYRWYYSTICQWCLGAVIAVVLLLAFVERPSSLSISSDPRHRSVAWEPPCGFTESIEMICLIVFSIDLAVKSYLIGWEEFRKSKWLISYTVVLFVSVIDWVLSVSMACDERLRIRRLFRPFFLLQNSSLMKKTLKCIKRTLPEIASVIVLLALHLCLFTMIGMLLFTKSDDVKQNGEWELHFRGLLQSLTSMLVLLTTANNPDVMIPAYSLNRGYSIFFITFSVIGTYCLMNLLTAIIYNQFRGYLLHREPHQMDGRAAGCDMFSPGPEDANSIHLFYCEMSVQTSIIRRRLGIRAAFQVLSCQRDPAAFEEAVSVDAVLEVMSKVKIKSYYRNAINMLFQRHAGVGHVDLQQFKTTFDELDKELIKEHPPLPQYSSPGLRRLQVIFSHRYLTLLGNVLALANVTSICIILVLNSEKSTTERDNYQVEVSNLCFILYYLFEMVVKIFAFGWRGYLSYKSNMFDGLLTLLLLVLQVSIFITSGLPDSYWDPATRGVMSLWEMVRLVNLLIVFRFLRIIPNIKIMALVASTLLDLVKNLRAFAGVLVVVYYVFAVFGIWLFEGAIKPPPEMSVPSNTSMKNITSNYSMECGTYEQLGYWPNNFDDFAAAIILLYDVMIVNNWQAFLEAYSRYTTEWSKLYFLCWWLTSSVMWVNLFVALILENFIYKWDRSHSCSVTDVEKIRYETSVQFMFKEQIQEPTEEELLCQLHQHPHLHLQ
ncbi:two pore channel protein 2 isoform X3 [Nothobranchius furzeri]|uniref:two pore channel protein 2 isoform X3 n=1 Tax=Nothobranchius furzeri TaxID=105023 RepID=UPI002403CDFA|nr:two pore channel protein 2 isoform X3 [Nothobranchius furzeri]